jgi:amino acid adenylation domain-containing protein
MITGKFERIVAENRDRVAIVSGESKLTYGQLKETADQVARIVLARSTSPGDTVGILLGHGTDQVIALLGVLEAHKIYVPLDSAYPLERLTRMLRDAGTGMIITDSEHVGLAKRLCEAVAAEKEIRLLLMDEFSLENIPEEETGKELQEEHYAYILYTSGSTGKPKGVAQTCENVCFYTDIYIKALSITPYDRITYLSSFSHDGAVQDIYSALLSGAQLCPLDIRLDVESNAANIGKWLINEKITMYHSVCSVLRYVTAALTGQQQFPNLRLVVTGGEKLYANDISAVREHFPAAALAHMYGQTESSVNTMGFVDTRQTGGKITLGEPLQGIRLLLLNEEGEQVEPYEEGEIFVACKHIAPGYWQNPEASGKAFLFDEDMGPVYRTGDLGKYDSEGNIEFIGRKDLQVKIRGFRVEPGEIESLLLEHEKITAAAVIDRERDSGETYLCAYIVSEETIAVPGLRQYLSAALPAYMIPAYFVRVAEVPLTPNGKTDRRALPAPRLTPAAYKAPADETQQKLAAVFAKVLNISEDIISADASFFELGGNSMNLITLIADIHKEFPCEIPVAKVFEDSSIEHIALLIKAGKTIDDQIVLLNRPTGKKLFCFPPRIGFGLSFHALASALPAYSLYAFNFIEADDRVRQYADLIVQHQPGGPYVLLGWSAGGRLTFQTAAQLEQRGLQVSDIILVDSQWQGEAYSAGGFGEKEIEIIKKIGTFIEELGLAFLKDRAMKKMEIYTRCNMALTHLDTINARVHYILSEENKDKNQASLWKQFTADTFTVYQGFGDHEEMLTPGPLLGKNTALVREILKYIK